MVIGSGMMAKAFSCYCDSDDVLIFASGVSNSSENDPLEFLKEQNMVINAIHEHKEKIFVYFSTCSIEDLDVAKTLYVQHKLKMERTIEDAHLRHLIFRLPQVVGHSENKMTLVNFFYDSIIKGKTFNVWSKAERYIIDIDDVVKIARYIIDNRVFLKRTINIASKPYRVLEIIKMLEKIIGISAKYVEIERGSAYEIDCSEIKFVMEKIGIYFDENYLEGVLRKYYS